MIAIFKREIRNYLKATVILGRCSACDLWCV